MLVYISDQVIFIYSVSSEFLNRDLIDYVVLLILKIALPNISYKCNIYYNLEFYMHIDFDVINFYVFFIKRLYTLKMIFHSTLRLLLLSDNNEREREREE